LLKRELCHLDGPLDGHHLGGVFYDPQLARHRRHGHQPGRTDRLLQRLMTLDSQHLRLEAQSSYTVLFHEPGDFGRKRSAANHRPRPGRVAGRLVPETSICQQVNLPRQDQDRSIFTMEPREVVLVRTAGHQVAVQRLVLYSLKAGVETTGQHRWRLSGGQRRSSAAVGESPRILRSAPPIGKQWSAGGPVEQVCESWSKKAKMCCQTSPLRTRSSASAQIPPPLSTCPTIASASDRPSSPRRRAAS